MKIDLLETFLGQLIQKVHSGASGPQGLITYWKLFWPFWSGLGAAAGAGKAGGLMTYEKLFWDSLGGCRLRARRPFLLWFTHKLRIVNFLLIKNLFDKSAASRLRPGDPFWTYLLKTFWAYLLEKFLAAESPKTYLKLILMKVLRKSTKRPAKCNLTYLLKLYLLSSVVLITQINSDCKTPATAMQKRAAPAMFLGGRSRC